MILPLNFMNHSCHPFSNALSVVKTSEASIAAVAIFGREFGNFFPTTKAEPIVPGFAQAVAGGEVLLVKFVALVDLGENSFHRKIVRVENRVAGADGRGMVRVAACDQRQ